MSKTVGFFDSGIGGLPYLSYMREKAPQHCYKYLADSKNFPYGIKSTEEIKHIVKDLIGIFIHKQSPSIIVVACNTASVTALDMLRECYDIPFIGVVPAIKPAAGISTKGRIGLFATNRTVSDIYTDNLIKSYASSCEVISFADPGIVSFVEKRFFKADDNEIIETIKPAVDYFLKNSVDNIILGCTHFLFLEKYFKMLVPENVKIVDSREGVVNQAMKVLSEIENINNNLCDPSFYLTSEDKETENYKIFAEYFNLNFAGLI